MIKRTERGWGGHYICAASCLFRRNTLLSLGDTHVVVSTVGAYRINGEVSEIGINRWYETMVFMSKTDDTEYHDADVSRQVLFASKWAISEKYADNEANQMHENVVAELIGRMEDGKSLETSGD